MKNKIDDLRNHLFEQLERLGNEQLTPDELEHEIKRGKAIRHIADGVISSAKAETDRLTAVGEYQTAAGSALMATAETKQLQGPGNE